MTPQTQIGIPAFLRKPTTKARHGKVDDINDVYAPLLAIWLIEMALGLNWHRMKRPGEIHNCFIDDNFLTLTRVRLCPTEGEDIFDKLPLETPTSLKAMLKQRLAALQRTPIEEDLPLFANVELMSNILSLSDPEKAVLTFAILINGCSKFRSAISASCEATTTRGLAQIIAMLSGQNDKEVYAALREDAPLVVSGVIGVNQNPCDLEQKLDCDIAAVLLQPICHENDLIARFLKPASPPTLTLTSFPHLRRDIETLQRFIANALIGKEHGINILFYGPPGTGKTELAKAIAASLQVDLLETPFADIDGDPIPPEKRLRDYNLCQKLLARRQNAIMMFDEIEDVFEGRSELWSMLGVHSTHIHQSGKAWINRTLERNLTPTFWITNDPNIDPAYLRRFDYSVRFPVPPQKVRIDIARHHFATFAPNDDWLTRMSTSEHTTPAQMERAAKVARIASGDNLDQARTTIEQVLDRSARLLNQKRTPQRNQQHTRYDLRFINTDIDIVPIVAGLKRRPRGNFCFFGVAGSGKTELARHIADEIGQPIQVHRASDLLSKWVGEAEKNIAAMFDSAREHESMVVLDEADSFFSDRRTAQANWEVTQVNELLTQMEAFDGLFICTTNLMQAFDQASLRRFDFKIKFNYLKPEQRIAMFAQELQRMGGECDIELWSEPLRRLDKLTPGDFSVAVRQYELLHIPATAQHFYEQLRHECATKEESRAIGFAV